LFLHLRKGFLLLQLYNHHSHSESLPPTAGLRAGVGLHPGPIKRKASQASDNTKGPHKILRQDHDRESQSPKIHTARVRRASASLESGSSDDDDDAPGMGVDFVGATSNHGLDEDEERQEPQADGTGKYYSPRRKIELE
jgi:hypothetical protein